MVIKSLRQQIHEHLKICHVLQILIKNYKNRFTAIQKENEHLWHSFIPAFGLTLSWNKLHFTIYSIYNMLTPYTLQGSLFLNSDSMSHTETEGTVCSLS